MHYSEDELISEIKRRNQDAFEILIKEYTKPVYYLAYNILKAGCGKEDIEECVSDVLLEIWMRIHEFDCQRGVFKTWIFMLTKYKALKYRQKSTKQNAVNIDDYEIEEATAVEKTVIDREKQEKLIQTINQFNQTDRALFIRRYFYGEKINDLITAFGLSRSAIDNRLLRGRKVIKEVLYHE